MPRALELLIASARRNEGCALVTLVGIHGAAPRRIGAQMAVTEGGEIAGSFSGGCLDRSVIEDARRALTDGVFPDLLVVDGGKGQLSAALAVLAELGLGHVPTIGLAKPKTERRRGDEEVTFDWLAEQLRTFVDLHPDFEVPVERLATWLARLDDEDE